MKKIKCLLVALLLVGVSIGSLTACSKKGFKVTVYDVDGSPCTWVGTQVCHVEDNGTLGKCYAEYFEADENGVIYVDSSKLDANENWLEFHLARNDGGKWDPHLTYDTTRLHKGDSVEIHLKNRVNFDTPKSGDGTGEYVVEEDVATDYINSETFNPYVVENNSEYKVKFENATDRIYFAITLDTNIVEMNYNVYLSGDVSVKLVELQVVSDGIKADGNASHVKEGKELSYDYVVKAMSQDADGNYVESEVTIYFELSPSSASDLNKEFIVCFADAQ